MTIKRYVKQFNNTPSISGRTVGSGDQRPGQDIEGCTREVTVGKVFEFSSAICVGGNAQVRWEDISTNEPIEMDPRGYNVGPKDREGEYWTAEYRLMGRLQEDDWWTVDI